MAQIRITPRELAERLEEYAGLESDAPFVRLALITREIAKLPGWADAYRDATAVSLRLLWASGRYRDFWREAMPGRDYGEGLSIVKAGRLEATAAWAPALHPAHHPDVEKARRLLAESGTRLSLLWMASEAASQLWGDRTLDSWIEALFEAGRDDIALKLVDAKTSWLVEGLEREALEASDFVADADDVGTIEEGGFSVFGVHREVETGRGKLLVSALLPMAPGAGDWWYFRPASAALGALLKTIYWSDKGVGALDGFWGMVEDADLRIGFPALASFRDGAPRFIAPALPVPVAKTKAPGVHVGFAALARGVEGGRTEEGMYAAGTVAPGLIFAKKPTVYGVFSGSTGKWLRLFEEYVYIVLGEDPEKYASKATEDEVMHLVKAIGEATRDALASGDRWAANAGLNLLQIAAAAPAAPRLYAYAPTSPGIPARDGARFFSEAPILMAPTMWSLVASVPLPGDRYTFSSYVAGRHPWPLRTLARLYTVEVSVAPMLVAAPVEMEGEEWDVVSLLPADFLSKVAGLPEKLGVSVREVGGRRIRTGYHLLGEATGFVNCLMVSVAKRMGLIDVDCVDAVSPDAVDEYVEEAMKLWDLYWRLLGD